MTAVPDEPVLMPTPTPTPTPATAAATVPEPVEEPSTTAPGVVAWSAYPSMFVEKDVKSATHPDDVEFVVTEKVDGANIAIHVRVPSAGEGAEDASSRSAGTLVAVHSRNRKLEDTEGFHNVRDAVRAALPDVTRAIAELGLEEAILYGEVYGNWFPGKRPNGQAVQRRVAYTHETRIVVFDVHDGTRFLDYDELARVRLGVLVKSEFRGTWDNAVAFAKANLARVSAYSEDTTKDASQVIEGFVIRSAKERIVATKYKDYRTMYKYRNPGFTEILPGPRAAGDDKGADANPDAIKARLAELELIMSSTWFCNLVSKEPRDGDEIPMKDFRKWLDLAVAELTKNGAIGSADTAAMDKTLVPKVLRDRVAEFNKVVAADGVKAA